MNIKQKMALVAVGSASVGAAAGYIYAKKTLERKYSQHAEDEIESVKETYNMLTKQGGMEDDRKATDAYLERLDELGYMARVREEQEAKVEEEGMEVVESEVEIETVEVEVETEEEPPSTRVIKPEIDVRKERRDPKIPYLITTDEFMEDRQDFEKITINYYRGDDTLADERDEIIPDVEGTVLRPNLDRWGEGSDSKYSVYVRNERLGTDFEVLLEEGSYSEMIFGNPQIAVPLGMFPKES